MPIRPAALGAALLTLAALALPAQAHDGHSTEDHAHGAQDRHAHAAGGPDHDHASAPLTASPRGEARSAAFELVAVLRGQALTLYLDDARTNAPVRDAALRVETPEGAREAAAAEDGTYTLPAPWLAAPGHHDLVVAVSASASGEDRLALDLDVPEPQPPEAAPAGLGARVSVLAGHVRASLPGPALPLAAALGAAFLLGLLSSALLRGRRSVPALALLALAATVMLGTAAFAHGGDDDHDEPGAATAPGAASDLARRLPDGSVFVPKETQRLLGLRTDVTAQARHRRSVALPGRLIPDPNASGVVQSAVGGRLSPPESGLFPRLGSRVRRGEVMATVTPPVQAVDVSDMRQTQGELDQQIAIVERRVERYRRLVPSGAVAQVQLDDALAELKGLRDRRGALDRIRREPEPLVAPVDGVVAQAAAVAGQMAAPGTMVFQIVDPDRLWVEALSFDGLAAAGDAAARLPGGRSLALAYRGAGLADRNQAVPVQFAVLDGGAGLRMGQFVTVLAGTDAERTGIGLPREAVVRAANGQDVVYEHVSAERFRARPVRAEPLDGARLLVADGLAAGRRVVVQGAELLDQVR